MRLLVKNTAKYLFRVMSIMKHNSLGFNSLAHSDDDLFEYIASVNLQLSIMADSPCFLDTN